MLPKARSGVTFLIHPFNNLSKMQQQWMTCQEANKLDLVDYLRSLGFVPQKIRGHDYWYLSPLRDEATASFKVNRNKNVWYDHGSGKGGRLIDFGLHYHQCPLKDLLEKLSAEKAIDFSFHQPQSTTAGERKKEHVLHGKIAILSSSVISSPELINYLSQRKIPLAVARHYCSQICFEINGKKQLAVGFPNESGGYELRNHFFKGSSSPKLLRLIRQTDTKEVIVFEGFFSFLSFQTLTQSKNNHLAELPTLQSNSLILNTIAFFERSREIMESHDHIHLFLDNDKTGKNCTQKALQWSPKYKDHSGKYVQHKDLNEYLVALKSQSLKQGYRKGLSP